MFKKLTDFSYKRNRKEAFGFYFAYLLIALILAGVCGALTAGDTTTFQEGFEAGVQSKVVPVVMAVYIFSISILIFIKRSLKFRYLILLIANLLLVIFGGAILGLIVPAFMTTRNVMKED